MAASHTQVSPDPQPYKNIAAEPFDKGHALDWICRISAGYFNVDRPCGHALEDLPDDGETLFYFTNANPHSAVDVAVLARRHDEGELVVRRIARGAAGSGIAAPCPADTAARGQLPSQARA